TRASPSISAKLAATPAAAPTPSIRARAGPAGRRRTMAVTPLAYAATSAIRATRAMSTMRSGYRPSRVERVSTMGRSGEGRGFRTALTREGRCSRISACSRGFHAEPLPVGVDRENPDRHVGVDRPALLVREAGEAVGLDERSERHLLGHHAVDDVTDLVAGQKLLPAHVSPPLI